MGRLKGDGVGHGQIGGVIVRARILEKVEEVGAEGQLALLPPPPADDQRFHQPLHFRPGIKESCPLGGAKPLVAIPGVEIRAEGRQVERNLSRRVRAVDDSQDARGAGAGTNGGHWKGRRRGRGDVAEEDDPRARRDGCPQALNKFIGRGKRQGHGHAHNGEASLPAHVAPRPLARAVLMVGRQHLVAWPQPQRAGYDVDAEGRVGHVDQVIGRGAEVVAQRCARRGQIVADVAAEKLYRLLFQPALPRLIGVEDGPRRRAEGAVVEKHHAGVEQEFVSQGVRHRTA